jgi:heme-degrading monooxygenase HmoA
VSYQLAQVNIARLLAPLESEQLSSFVASLDPVNASADEAPGFIWRLQSEEGNATSIQAFDWDKEGSAGVIVNMSVWESLEQLAHWVYGDLHRTVLRQRRNWFERVVEATTALWWLPAGHLPDVSEAESRVLHLRTHGPTPHAFTFKQSFPSPAEVDATTSRVGDARWLCPT